MNNLLIFGYGNLSRGDDALGPLLLQQLEQLSSAQQWQAIDLQEDFQLQAEHAMDLIDRDLVLFIDASVSAPPPYRFELLDEARDQSYTSHAMSPAAVLYTYRTIYHRPPPPAWLLSIRGQQFELGQPLSIIAEQYLQQASMLVEKLCQQAQSGQALAYCDRVIANA